MIAAAFAGPGGILVIIINAAAEFIDFPLDQRIGFIFAGGPFGVELNALLHGSNGLEVLIQLALVGHAYFGTEPLRVREHGIQDTLFVARVTRLPFAV